MEKIQDLIEGLIIPAPLCGLFIYVAIAAYIEFGFGIGVFTYAVCALFALAACVMEIVYYITRR